MGAPVDVAGSPVAAVLEATPPPAAPAIAPAPTPVPFDLGTLQVVKEELRQQHPDWYPDFRDAFGNQLTEQLLPAELAKLSAVELGASAGPGPIRP